MQTGSTTVVYAGFWRRLAAILIDGLILSVVTVPLTLGMTDADRDVARTLASGASGLSTLVS